MMDYRLSPSDLTFLYDGCKHCFVLKVKHGIAQPSIPLPGVFSTIAALQKNYYSGRRTEEFCPQLPPGTITYGEQRVCSAPIAFKGLASTCHLAGRFDIVASLDNGSYAVLDFKTGNISEDKAAMYGRQLHAYALALETPAPGELQLAPVTRLGLLYFTPDQCEYIGGSRQALHGPVTWLEVERDDSLFRSFLGDVVSLLDGPMSAADAGACDWCRYRSRIVDASGRSASDPQESTGGVVTPPCPTCGAAMRLRSGKHGEFWGCTKYPDCRGTRPA
jgi:hypothetical protein